MSHYTVSTWKDLPNYCCNYCSFSTVNERKMLAHLQRQHPLVAVPPERKTSPVPVIYDAVGRLVQPQAPGDDHNAGEENLEEIENGT